jgi:hypothetical protein
VLGKPNQFIGQQLQCPASAPSRCARTGGRHQQSFLFARQLTTGPGSRLFAQGRLEVAEYKAALGSIDGRAADPHADGNVLVGGSGVGRQQDLRSLELACLVFSRTDQRLEVVPLGLAEFNPIA